MAAAPEAPREAAAAARSASEASSPDLTSGSACVRDEVAVCKLWCHTMLLPVPSPTAAALHQPIHHVTPII